MLVTSVLVLPQSRSEVRGSEHQYGLALDEVLGTVQQGSASKRLELLSYSNVSPVQPID